VNAAEKRRKTGTGCVLHNSEQACHQGWANGICGCGGRSGGRARGDCAGLPGRWGIQGARVVQFTAKTFTPYSRTVLGLCGGRLLLLFTLVSKLKTLTLKAARLQLERDCVFHMICGDMSAAFPKTTVRWKDMPRGQYGSSGGLKISRLHYRML
jgi:hypothetical protein